MEKKIEHLKLIQGVITRMASNSFALKGWAVTLAAGIFALASKDSDKMYFLVSYIPCFMFWLLDSYYLRQERLYRALYDKVRKDSGSIDYSLNAWAMLNDTSLSDEKREKFGRLNCFSSVSEILFYVPLIFVNTIIILLTNWVKLKDTVRNYWFLFLLPFVFLAAIYYISNRKNINKKQEEKRQNNTQ